MGEYWTDRKGETLAKLGTMDDWRYVSRAEALKIAPLDGGHTTSVPSALRDAGTLWRFPWPDEVREGTPDPNAIRQRSMERTITFAPPVEMVRALEHGARVVHFSADHGREGAGGYGVNVWVPCLAGPLPYPFKTSPVGPLPVSIYGERHDERGPRTIFRCGYCGHPFSLGDGDELAAFRVAILEQAPRVHWPPEAAADAARRFKWFEAVAEALRPALPEVASCH